MTTAETELTLAEARERHFSASGLPPDGGYDDRWVHIHVGPFAFAYPNTEGRRRVAPAHDLHHVLTGYATDLTGEGELGAWEVGAGCRERTGLLLALLVFGFSLAWSPRRMFEAFLRGRYCRNLLDTRCERALLQRSVASVRAELGLQLPPPAAMASDYAAFARWASIAAAIVWGPLVPVAALVWWLVRQALGAA